MRQLPLALLLCLAACGSGEEAGNNSSAEATTQEPPAEANIGESGNSVVPLEPAPPQPTPQPAPSVTPIAALPSAFRGRWGMVPNDCVPGRDDAKGLMIVSADGLGFYESRGRIEKAAAIGPGRLTLDLAFTGEGQEWNRRETLTLLDAGKTLVREEQKPAGSFRYSKCPAGRAPA